MSEYSYIRYGVYVLGADGLIMPSIRTKKVKNTYVKRFQNCQHKLFKLTKCAEMLLRFLTEEMDSVNSIHNSKSFRKSFRVHMQKDCGMSYADVTVKKAFKELVDQDLLISWAVKSTYTVNPMYFFCGSEKERIALLQSLMKDAAAGNFNKGSNLKRAMKL